MIPTPARIDAEDIRTLEALKADGWREIEILETYRGKPAGKICWYARRAVPKDVEACVRIATKAFKYDRLHMDPKVSDKDAMQVKENWVRGCFSDPGCMIFVYNQPPVIGFLTCKWLSDDGLVVDLIATTAPRRGVCTGLIKHAMHELRPAYLKAGTQRANEDGRNFYNSLGMIRIKCQRTLHKP